MRCSAWSSLAISVYSALALAAPAAAHVTPTPSFITAGGTSSLSLTGPNERGEPMTAFAVTVPDGFRIVHAEPVDDWVVTATESTAAWLDGSLDAEDEATFTLDIEAPDRTGPIELEAVQRYPRGEAVKWSITLTVVPGSVSESVIVRDPLRPVILGGLAFVVLAIGVSVVRRKRRRSLQEQ